MGQSASAPSALPAGSTAPPSRRSSVFWRRSSPRQADQSQTTANNAISHSASRPREASTPQSRRADRISDMLHQVLPHSSSAATRIRRSRRSSAYFLPDHSSSSRERSLQDLLDENLRNAATPRPARPEISLPRVDLPASTLGIDFASNDSSAPQRPASHRSSLRPLNSLSDRLSGFRQNRSVTTTTTNTVLRRRRAPLASSEDNAALLSRLLSVAAATTAQTLLEGTEHSMAEARGTPMDGEDGTWDSFLQSLESGPLSLALREGSSPSSAGGRAAALNLFRLFRFAPRASDNNTSSSPRMVPIIIVGIRSVVPGALPDGSDDSLVPSFLEALTTTPINPRTLHRNYNSRRRRASMGGVGQPTSGFDTQRHERSNWRVRPQSVAADMSWPRPPPATPATPGSFASPESSAESSRESSPAPMAEEEAAPFDGPESVIRTTTTTTLETTTQPEAQPAPRPRAGADTEHRNSTYNTRRNGMVEPDAPPSESTRSWIIYVLGGSYPENHPLLHTPSLFTDSPTYEDMLLLSTLVAPAKPPVASDTDVASAGGIYDIQSRVNDQGRHVLVAVERNGHKVEELVAEQRCLVCLCDLEKNERARKLGDCGHLFHQECIDEWLTKGRNSCPLCRSEGVKKAPIEVPVDSVAPTPILPSDAHMPSLA